MLVLPGQIQENERVTSIISRRCPPIAHLLPTDTRQSKPGKPSEPEPGTDPDLVAVVAARPELPEAIRAGIVAMVKAARP